MSWFVWTGRTLNHFSVSRLTGVDGRPILWRKCDFKNWIPAVWCGRSFTVYISKLLLMYQKMIWCSQPRQKGTESFLKFLKLQKKIINGVWFVSVRTGLGERAMIVRISLVTVMCLLWSCTCTTDQGGQRWLLRKFAKDFRTVKFKQPLM